MRQTVRLNEVRAPDAPQDGLSPAQVYATDDVARTLDVHYDGVLTQLRNILGTPTWRDAPAQSVQALAQGQTQAQATLAAQNVALDQQGQQLAQLLGQAQSLAALQTQVGYIRTGLVQLSAQAANKDALSQLANQVGSMDAALADQLARITAQVAALAQTSQTDHTRLNALEQANADYVTQTGLNAILRQAYVMDAPLRGPRNGINLRFTLDEGYEPSTLRVHYNGQSLRAGPAGDYVVVADNDGLQFRTIRLLFAAAAPFAQDALTATYIPATA